MKKYGVAIKVEKPTTNWDIAITLRIKSKTYSSIKKIGFVTGH